MKHFWRKHHKRLLMLKIKHLAKTYGIQKIRFRNLKKTAGLYHLDCRGITLSSQLKNKTTLCAFFHELAHHICVLNTQNIWPFTADSPLKIFKAENQIDRLAKILWRQHVNTKSWGQYVYFYPISSQKKAISFLTDYYRF